MSSVDERSAAGPPPADPLSTGVGGSGRSARPKRPARSKRRRRLARTLILLLILVAGFVVVAESLSLVRHARAAQASLEAFKTSLQNNDAPGAQRHLRDADASLSVARHSYDSLPLVIARHIPFLGWPVSDAGRLLNAATDVSSAGQDALGLYEQVRGSGSKLFHNDTVSLTELDTVTRNADGMVAKMDSAERQLKAVHAAFWEPSVGHARDSALRQVTSLRAQGRTAQRLLDLAPRLVGADGVRTYLVAVLNPAELEGAGGAALNLMAIRFNHGHMKILQSGSTFDITNQNTPTHFKPLPDDPWLAGATATVLGAADRSPDFRTSGAELMRGYTAQFGTKVDGIIALDPLALRGLMQQVPPFDTPGYGHMTADNIVPTLLVDSYAKYPDLSVRHVYNDQLMNGMLHQILGGGHMLGKGKALQQAAAAGHLQVLMKDPAVQQEVTMAHLLRTLPTPDGADALGVYTANANASKVDYWQRRSIDQRVTIRPDGSASVVRTVTIVNASPPFTGPGVDLREGYLTRVADMSVALYMPQAAQNVAVRINGARERPLRKDERGLRIAYFRPMIVEQGKSLRVVLHYVLPAGALRSGTYRLMTTAQPMVRPIAFSLSVSGPGTCRGQGAGWSTAAGSVRWSTKDLVPATLTAVCG
jgi:hypothetical protein